MASFYSVLRYTPHPVSEESINFGLIAFSDEVVELCFTEDWSRATTFGRKHPTALREAVKELTRLHEQNALTAELVRHFAEKWQREVVLTPPRASTMAAPDLLEQLSRDVLRFPPEATHNAGKRYVLGVARTSVLSELVRRFKVSKNRARGAMRTGAEFEGRVKGHALDIALFNGAFLGGGLGMSLAHPSKPQVEREIDAVAFVLGDLRAQPAMRKKPLYVLAHTHGVDNRAVMRAEAVFSQVGGELVAEPRIEKWSRQFVELLPDQVFAD
jgi:hypothetical protein